MDPRERVPDQQEVVRQAIRDALQDVMTCAPVKIVSFNPTNWTADAQVQLLVRHEVPAAGGKSNPVGIVSSPPVFEEPKDSTVNYVWEQQQMLKDCPVVFLSGGGFTIFAPPKPGDEALAIFAHRSIDEWWLTGRAMRRGDLRTHSIADAFILAGVASKFRANTSLPVDPNSFEIRSTDGTIMMRMDPTGVAITAPQITLNGAVIINGPPVTAPGGIVNFGGEVHVAGDVTAAGKSLEHHVHSGVSTGGGTSGPPV